MDNKTCIEIVVYKPCLLKENVSYLIKFVALRGVALRCPNMSIHCILFLRKYLIHSSSAKGILGNQLKLFCSSLKVYKKM